MSSSTVWRRWRRTKVRAFIGSGLSPVFRTSNVGICFERKPWKSQHQELQHRSLCSLVLLQRLIPCLWNTTRWSMCIKTFLGKQNRQNNCVSFHVYINPGNCLQGLAGIQFTAKWPRSQMDIIVNRFGERIKPHSGRVIVPGQGVN